MNFAKGTQTRAPAAAPGIHCAGCVGVFDLGLQAPSGQFAGGKPSDKVLLAWEVQSGELVTKEYTRLIDQWKDKQGVVQSTNLKKHLESWFAPAKIDDPSKFDAKKLLGQHCQLVLSHTAGGYAKIDAITRPDPSKMNWEPVRQYAYYEVGDEIPEGTENWVVNRINSRIQVGEAPQQSPKDGSQESAPASSQRVPF